MQQKYRLNFFILQVIFQPYCIAWPIQKKQEKKKTVLFKQCSVLPHSLLKRVQDFQWYPTTGKGLELSGVVKAFALTTGSVWRNCNKLSDNQTWHTQFRGANAIVMAESATALAHDHSLKSAGTLESHFFCSTVRECLNAKCSVLASTVADAHTWP